MQHQILQGRCSQRPFVHVHRFFGRLRGRTESGSNYFEPGIFDLALDHVETLEMSGLIGIDFRRPVEALRRFGELCCAAIQIEQLQQRTAVITLTV